MTLPAPTVVDFGHLVAGVYTRPGATADPVSDFAGFFRTTNPGETGRLTLANGEWYVARYVRLPAHVPIDVVGFRFVSDPNTVPATIAVPGGKMPGAFLASDPELTRIWYSAASTMQLSMMTTSPGEGYQFFDSPERDRSLWLWYDAVRRRHRLLRLRGPRPAGGGALLSSGPVGPEGLRRVLVRRRPRPERVHREGPWGALCLLRRPLDPRAFLLGSRGPRGVCGLGPETCRRAVPDEHPPRSSQPPEPGQTRRPVAGEPVVGLRRVPGDGRTGRGAGRSGHRSRLPPQGDVAQGRGQPVPVGPDQGCVRGLRRLDPRRRSGELHGGDVRAGDGTTVPAASSPISTPTTTGSTTRRRPGHGER